MRVFPTGRGIPPERTIYTIQRWEFNESASGDSLRTAIQSGETLTGANSPGVVTTSSIGPGARSFNGSNQRFVGSTAGGDADALCDEGYTVYFSFRLSTSWAARGDVVSYGSPLESLATNNLLHLWVSSDRYLTVFYETGAGLNATDISTGAIYKCPVKLPTGKWIHGAVVVRYEAIDTYLFGDLAYTGTMSVPLPEHSGSTAVWRVGCSESAGDHFNGDIEFIQVDSTPWDITTIGPNLARMQGRIQGRSVRVRASVADSGGTLRDMTNLAGQDWLISANWEDSADANVASASLRFHKEFRNEYTSDTPLSLAKMNNNRMNRSSAFTASGPDGTTYSQYTTELLELSRRVTIEACRVPEEYTPTTSDWVTVFDGYIDSIDWGSDAVEVKARDKGARLIDCFIQDEKKYGSTGGTAITSVVASILSDAASLWGLASAPTLYVAGTSAGVGENNNTSLSWNLKLYEQYKETVLSALTTLFDQIGWSLKYRWNYSTSAFELTAFDPNREKTYGDAYIPEWMILDVSSLSVELDNIRNIVRLSYPTRESSSPTIPTISSGTSTVTPGAITKFVGPTSPTSEPGVCTYTIRADQLHSSEVAYNSIATYGSRYMEVVESTSYNIDTITEAQKMAVAILRDLAFPRAQISLELLNALDLEVFDQLYLPADSRFFTSAQRMAIVSISHSYESGSLRTRVEARGYPGGGVVRSLGKEARPGNGPATPTNPAFAAHGATYSMRKRAVAGLLLGSRHLAGTRQGLINNPHWLQSFDNTVPPDAWDVDGSTVWGTDASMDTSVLRNGASSLKLWRRAYDTGIQSRVFPVGQNQTVLAECWAIASVSGSSVLSVDIRFYDSSMSLLSTSTGSTTLSTSSWKHCIHTASTTSSSVRWAAIRIRCPSTNTANEIVWASELDCRKPPPQARVYRSSGDGDQDMPTKNTANTVKFLQENYDYGNGYDTGTWTYTATEAGFYEIESSVGITFGSSSVAIASRIAAIRINKNSGTILAYSPTSVNNNFGFGIGSAFALCHVKVGRVYLAVGDTIKVEANSYDGDGADIIGDEALTWLSIRKHLTE